MNQRFNPHMYSTDYSILKVIALYIDSCSQNKHVGYSLHCGMNEKRLNDANYYTLKHQKCAIYVEFCDLIDRCWLHFYNSNSDVSALVTVWYI